MFHIFRRKPNSHPEPEVADPELARVKAQWEDTQRRLLILQQTAELLQRESPRE